MRYILIVAGLLGAVNGAAAQEVTQSKREATLPDSTYLAFTLELPTHGTFHVNRRQMRTASYMRNTAVAVRVDYMIDRVEVAGCRMLLYRRNGGNPRTATKTDLPLKQLDPESLKAQRIAGSTIETTPWMIRGKAIDRSERPFVDSRPGRATVTAVNEFELALVDEFQATRYLRLLKDAISRCETWHTSPISPIR